MFDGQEDGRGHLHIQEYFDCTIEKRDMSSLPKNVLWRLMKLLLLQNYCCWRSKDKKHQRVVKPVLVKFLTLQPHMVAILEWRRRPKKSWPGAKHDRETSSKTSHKSSLLFCKLKQIVRRDPFWQSPSVFEFKSLH